MRNSKTLLKMIIIVVLAATHIIESCSFMHMGEILATEYCMEDDEEDEEEIFERMSILSDTRRTRKVEIR
jgi:hypothetical protein